jgi:hypothetical protein
MRGLLGFALVASVPLVAVTTAVHARAEGSAQGTALPGSAPSGSAAEELPAGSDLPRLRPIAVVDTYFAWHDPRPPGRTATRMTTAVRHGEATINLAAIGLRLEHAQLTGTLVLHAGTSVDAHAEGIPAAEVWKHIQLANAGWRFGDLHVEAGAMPSLYGGESFVSTDNWNYTRTIVADHTPYFVVGARASYRISPAWTVVGTIFDGWSLFRNDDGNPTGQLRVAYAPSESFSIANSFLFGPEGPDRGIVRLIDDLYVTWNPHARVGLQAELWGGSERGAAISDPRREQPREDPLFYGAALWARWTFGSTTYLAARGEFVSDEAGILTGTGARSSASPAVALIPGQRMIAGTVTLGWRPHPSLLGRIEALHRTSDEPYFGGGDAGDPKKRSTTFVGSLAWAY